MSMRGFPGEELTPREKECVALLAEGLSDVAIGSRLALSEDTTKSHLRNARNKIVPRPTGRVELANAWRKIQGEDVATLRAQIAERDAVISNARHEFGCDENRFWSIQYCKCWKADYEAAKEAQK